MEQELKYKVGIIGGGPAGCICAYFLQNECDVTVFNCGVPLRTLLPTGGGRCNLAHAIYDFRNLAENYPRGEKFLYSVFSIFSTADTLDFFKKIGVETYTQDDGRIFPVSDSAKDVRAKMLNNLKKVNFINERAVNIEASGTLTVTTNCASYNFDKIVIASGGHSSYIVAKKLGHKIIEPKPALTGLKTKEDVSSLAGISIDGVLFTHEGISGPEVYKISSLNARKEYPYILKFNFAPDINLQEMLNKSPHKTIKNILSEIIPQKLALYILKQTGIDAEEKAHKINGTTRDKILEHIQLFSLTVTSPVKDGEVVTSGGVCLDEINPKTMMSKLVPNVYFCGEVMDIDGFCGGFNLQNCWSTGFIAAQSILNV